jgi:hypothetical protein
MLEEVKSILSAGNVEALGDVSSSLRTTLSQKLRDVDFSVLLGKGAAKRHQDAEKMLPEYFVNDCGNDCSIVALRYV